MITFDANSKIEKSQSAIPNQKEKWRTPFFTSSTAPENAFFGLNTVQPKLEINQPNDQYEKEAEAVADNVMLQTREEEEKEIPQMKPSFRQSVGIQRQESSETGEKAESKEGGAMVAGSALRFLIQGIVGKMAPTVGRAVSIGVGPFDTASSAKKIADGIAEGDASRSIRGALGLINTKIGTSGAAFSWHGALAKSASAARHGRFLLRFSGWGTVALLAYDIGKFVVIEAKTIKLDHPARRSQQRYEWEGHGWVSEE